MGPVPTRHGGQSQEWTPHMGWSTLDALLSSRHKDLFWEVGTTIHKRIADGKSAACAGPMVNVLRSMRYVLSTVTRAVAEARALH